MITTHGATSSEDGEYVSKSGSLFGDEGTRVVMLDAESERGRNNSRQVISDDASRGAWTSSWKVHVFLVTEPMISTGCIPDGVAICEGGPYT